MPARSLISDIARIVFIAIGIWHSQWFAGSNQTLAMGKPSDNGRRCLLHHKIANRAGFQPVCNGGLTSPVAGLTRREINPAHASPELSRMAYRIG